MKTAKRQRIILFLLFAIPGLILFIYLFAIPFLETFYYCFTDWNGISKTFNFVGIENFARLLKDKYIWIALWNNIKFCVIGGALTFGLAIFDAVAITQGKLREKHLYRVVFYIPNILSAVIISMLWMFIYNPNSGLLNGLLNGLGLEDWTRIWLGDKQTVVPCLIAVWVWMSMGFYMVMYISAIEGIPAELFEAADIDGATVWSKFRFITWPLVIETTKTSLVFFFINAFSGCFTLVNVMTEGGPARSSEVLSHYMYSTAFAQSQFGYASAIGVFIFAIVALLSGLLMFFTRRKDQLEF